METPEEEANCKLMTSAEKTSVEKETMNFANASSTVLNEFDARPAKSRKLTNQNLSDNEVKIEQPPDIEFEHEIAKKTEGDSMTEQGKDETESLLFNEAHIEEPDGVVGKRWIIERESTPAQFTSIFKFLLVCSKCNEIIRIPNFEPTTLFSCVNHHLVEEKCNTNPSMILLDGVEIWPTINEVIEPLGNRVTKKKDEKIYSIAPHRVLYGWQKLPPEMKCEVIKHLNDEARSNFRATSKEMKSLVDRTEYNRYSSLVIYKRGKMFGFRVEAFHEKFRQKYEFESPEEFADKLSTVLQKIRFIDLFTVGQKDWPHELGHGWLKLKNDRGMIPVRSFQNDNYQYLDIIQQINHKELNLFNVASDENIPLVYNTKQMIAAKIIHLKDCCITDEQLLKLTAKVIMICAPSKLTSTGVNKFIKERQYSTNFAELFISTNEMSRDEIVVGLRILETISFRRRDADGVHFLDSLIIGSVPDKILSLVFDNSRHTFRMKFKQRSSAIGKQLSLADHTFLVCLYIDCKDLTLGITHHKGPTVTAKFDSILDFEIAIFEVFSQLVYVKTIYLKSIDFPNWSMFVNNGKLPVVRFIYRGNSKNESLTRFIQQFDPKSLNKMELHGPMCNGLFETEQMTAASSVVVSDFDEPVEDTQLLKMNASYIALNGTNITPNGVNKLIKKWLTLIDLNNKNKYIVILLWKAGISLSTEKLNCLVCEDLDYEICEQERFGSSGHTIIYTKFPNIQILFSFLNGTMRLKIIEKDQRWMETEIKDHLEFYS